MICKRNIFFSIIGKFGKNNSWPCFEFRWGAGLGKKRKVQIYVAEDVTTE